MTDALSPRQMDVLTFINRFRSTEQCNPTCAEIADHFGWASANAAYDHLCALGMKGVIQVKPNTARGYRVSRGFESYSNEVAV